jgi:hypothetical protein
MHLDGTIENPIQELIRLTMLAFMTTTFKVPGRRIPYRWIVKELGNAYAKSAGGQLELDKSLHLWVLMTAAFTVTGAQVPWIREAWGKTGSGLDWTIVKTHLLRVMWIEMIHDRPGKKLFQQLEGFRYLG